MMQYCFLALLQQNTDGFLGNAELYMIKANVSHPKQAETRCRNRMQRSDNARVIKKKTKATLFLRTDAYFGFDASNTYQEMGSLLTTLCESFFFMLSHYMIRCRKGQGRVMPTQNHALLTYIFFLLAHIYVQLSSALFLIFVIHLSL